MFNKLVKKFCRKVMDSRPPDVIIGKFEDPYLLRWHVIPRNPWFNLYLHLVLKSDDDRALHDHPWVNLSYIVKGEYSEVTPTGRTTRKQGTFKARKPTALHRLELTGDDPCTTLFFTGPRVRTWGFQCPKGWVRWFDFTQKKPDGSYVAQGCGDVPPHLLWDRAEPSSLRNLSRH